MLSVTVRMSLNGVGLLDSMPIALYILPLSIFLPFMIRAFYRSRTSAWNFVFLIISSVFFSMFSLLVRGFIICIVLDISAVILIFLIGRFRPQGSFRQAGKKGIAYVLLLNMLSLTFPVSIVVMGQVPIASVNTSNTPQIALSVPLADFDFPYSNVTPTPTILTELETSHFGIDLRVMENDNESWTRLGDWVSALNQSTVTYTITLSSNRSSFVGEAPTAIGTTAVIQEVYSSHRLALTHLADALNGISNQPRTVLFDMTLSKPEWQMLMSNARSLDLIGFTGLMRRSIFSTDVTVINQEASALADEASSLALHIGVLIEPFVLDDLRGNDNMAMRITGITINSLTLWDTIQVSCSRSRFSLEMRGDVEAYLVESYSKSVGLRNGTWTMRLGELGNTTDSDGRLLPVYESFDVITNDVTLASGNGVEHLTLDSLPSLLSSFGPSAISELYDSLSKTTLAKSNYTFRVYAFRAVFIAIDSFDPLLF